MESIENQKKGLESLRFFLNECDKRIVGQTVSKEDHEKIASVRKNYIWSYMRLQMLIHGVPVEEASQKATELLDKVPDRVFMLETIEQQIVEELN